MVAFKPYAMRAAVAALAATALCLIADPVWRWLLSVEIVGFIPKALALTLGTVHNPSFLGLFMGFFVEWLAVCLLAALTLWQLKQHASNAT